MDLDISGLILRISLLEVETKLKDDLVDIFDPFVTGDGSEHHEILCVVPVKTRRWRGVNQERMSLIKEVLEEPLNKFPFVEDTEKMIGCLLKRVRPFLASPETKGYLSRVKHRRDIQVYHLPGGLLIRRLHGRESVLFLKVNARRRFKAASLYGAAYFIASNAMPIQDGLMLHGVGVSRFGSGVLFLGASGGGKTTVAELSPPGNVISDDCIIVKRKGEEYFLHPSPFNQYLGSNVGLRRRLAIGLFLEKDRSVYLQEISPSEACARILMNYIHFFRHYPSDTAEKSFELVTSMCNQTPFYVLHFNKTPSFWKLLEDRLFMLKPKIKEQYYGFEEEKTTLRTSQGL